MLYLIAEKCNMRGKSNESRMVGVKQNNAAADKKEISPADFSAMPFPNAKGYHSKTIAYSIWHTIRIHNLFRRTYIPYAV